MWTPAKQHRADTLEGNALFPATSPTPAPRLDIPWGHVSSGCIYSGAKMKWPRGKRPDPAGMPGRVREESRHNSPASPRTDEPNFTFRRPPCSFYSGTKALGEEAHPGRRPELYLAACASPSMNSTIRAIISAKCRITPRFMTTSIPSRIAAISSAPAWTSGSGTPLSAFTT